MASPQHPIQIGPTSGSQLPLMQCPVAGFQFHAGESSWRKLKKGDSLVLCREPGNRHDPRAIRVEWHGVMLGYVPREANFAASQMMDRGVEVSARIGELRASGDPWQRVLIEVRASAPDPAPDQGGGRRAKGDNTGGSPLDPCVRSKLRPNLVVAPNAPDDKAEREKGLRVLEDLLPEFTRRLSAPALASFRAGRRQVKLWESAVLSVAEDGCDLRIELLEGTTKTRPHLTLDLKHPIDARHWIEALLVPLIRSANAQGLTKTGDRPQGEQRREPGAVPWAPWLAESLRLTFRDFVDFKALRGAVLRHLAPKPLARSLANRIFAPGVGAAQFNWVCAHVEAIALTAVEQPTLLPFLRYVQADEDIADGADPAAELHDALGVCGMDVAAWKRLLKWGFAAFEPLSKRSDGVVASVARYANLLLALDVEAAPPALFAELAAFVGDYNEEDGTPSFEGMPQWFLRSLLRAAERATDEAAAMRLCEELPAALAWLLEGNLEADANQGRAGWAWITARARERAEALEKRRGLPWSVPLGAMTLGRYSVVPIGCAAELHAEAKAMKNCLATYEDACTLGMALVFSIREARMGKRVACFAVIWEKEGAGGWCLVEVAGPMNTTAGEELQDIGRLVLDKLGCHLSPASK